MKDFNVARYDANMADGLIDGGDVVWHGIEESPFRLGGLPFHAFLRRIRGYSD